MWKAYDEANLFEFFFYMRGWLRISGIGTGGARGQVPPPKIFSKAFFYESAHLLEATEGAFIIS